MSTLQKLSFGPSNRKVLDPLCSCLYLQKLASGSIENFNSFYRRIRKIQIWNILDCHVRWQHSNACFQWAVSVQRSLRVKRITLFASFSSQFSFDLCWCVLRFCLLTLQCRNVIEGNLFPLFSPQKSERRELLLKAVEAHVDGFRKAMSGEGKKW